MSRSPKHTAKAFGIYQNLGGFCRVLKRRHRYCQRKGVAGSSISHRTMLSAAEMTPRSVTFRESRQHHVGNTMSLRSSSQSTSNRSGFACQPLVPTAKATPCSRGSHAPRLKQRIPRPDLVQTKNQVGKTLVGPETKPSRLATPRPHRSTKPALRP